MKHSRKPYPDEFKQEAVRLLMEQRLPRSQVVRDLGVDPETLRRWARDWHQTVPVRETLQVSHPSTRPSSPGCVAKTSSSVWSAMDLAT